MIPTARRLRRLALVTATAAVFCTATPAHAVTATTTQSHAEAAITVTDCPATAGAHCLVFEISGEVDRPPNGTTTRMFGAVAKDAIVQPGGALAVTVIAASPASSIGTITMSADGRTGKLSMTVAMACLAPDCGVEGTYRFTQMLRDRPGSNYVGANVFTSERDDACLRTQRIVSKLHADFTGSGTIKRAGRSTLKVHVDTTQGTDNEVSAATSTARTTGSCPP